MARKHQPRVPRPPFLQALRRQDRHFDAQEPVGWLVVCMRSLAAHSAATPQADKGDVCRYAQFPDLPEQFFSTGGFGGLHHLVREQETAEEGTSSAIGVSPSNGADVHADGDTTLAAGRTPAGSDRGGDGQVAVVLAGRFADLRSDSLLREGYEQQLQLDLALALRTPNQVTRTRAYMSIDECLRMLTILHPCIHVCGSACARARTRNTHTLTHAAYRWSRSWTSRRPMTPVMQH